MIIFCYLHFHCGSLKTNRILCVRDFTLHFITYIQFFHFEHHSNSQRQSKKQEQQILRSSSTNYEINKKCCQEKKLLSYYPFPERQMLDSSTLKEFADDNFNFDKYCRKFLKRAENTVGIGEIARFEQFLLFRWCFQKTYTADTKKTWACSRKDQCHIIFNTSKNVNSKCVKSMFK